MNKADLLDLFEYTEFAWDQIRRAAPDDAMLVREAPGSGWPALRNCLGHMVLAYDRWVPAIVTLETADLPELKDQDFRSWRALQEKRDSTRRTLREHIEGWAETELSEIHDVSVYGEPIRYSRAELIVHLLLHERGHHGDATTLFWQLGIDAQPALEYRFHLKR